MAEKSKIYVDTVKGMLDQEAMTATAQVLLSLTDDPNDVEFHVDHTGHHFAVPTELFDKFRAAIEPKRKRGRPRKTTNGPAVDDLVMSPDEEIVADSNPLAETDLEE